MRRCPLLGLLALATLSACSSLADRAPETPEIFGPGRVSTRAREFATAFEPDGETVYLNVVSEGRILLVRCHAEGDGWSAQEPVPISDGSWPVVDPFVSFDGERLYFSSSGPPALGGTEDGEFALWSVRRDGDEWSDQPKRLEIDVPGSQVFCSWTRTGSLVFSARPEGEPRVLYRRFRSLEGLDPPRRIDVGLGEASLGNPLIAPDGSFLIFTANLPDGLGGADLYLARRGPGGWSEPELLPEPINSPWADFAPALGPKAQTFFFTSERPGMVPEEVEGRRPGDLYWVRLSALGL